ncbi:MAG: histidine triad nucleotide-binding protein [Candidatus Gracilibacteria bacterium]|jgi:histidine triad (HIT) family protein
MENCVFCKIINGEIPSDFLYQDELCVIFKDINPKADTHLLCVPKKHIETIIDMEEGDEKIIGHIVNKAKELAKKLNLPGYKLQFNVGKDGGQEVFHVHMHLMSNFS